MATPNWITPGLWGVVVGAATTMIVGFSWGGWVTGSSAEEMAATRTETAVVQALTPICVAEAKDADPAKLAELKTKTYYQRGDFVEANGWVSAVGEEYRDEVASACAPKIVEAIDAEAAKKPG